MRYIIIVAILLILAGCEEIQELVYDPDDVDISTGTTTVPISSDTYRVPLPSSGPIMVPCIKGR